MSGLWDYDDIKLEDSGPWASTKQPENNVVIEDEDGNGQLKKRGRGGRPSRTKGPAKASATAPVVVLDDSEDEFKITSAGILSPVTAAASTAASPLQPQLCDAARQALEQSRQLVLEQMKELGDDDDDDCSLDDMQPPKKAASMGPGSMRMPSSLRPMPLPRALSVEDDAACEAQASKGAAQAAAGGEAAAQAAAAAEPDHSDKQRVVLQCRHGSVEIRIRPTDALSKLLKAFLLAAVGKGWISSGPQPPSFKLQFEGDTVDQEQTPQALGLDDGDVVDVSWK